ncbi:unnamed protein product, partial [Prorocentrum cordatum]
DELITLRHLRLTLSPVSAYCYYLDPATEVVLESASTLSVSSSLLALDLREEKTAEERCAKMPYEEFLALLRRHQVPLSKFGRGSAKSLQEFYDAVVRDQKSYLIVHGGLLERVVELVRISLRTRGPGNRMHELKIRSEPNAEGGTRSRNQPLAMVIDQSMAGKWQEASQRCFEVKLGLSLKEQQAYFTVDRSAYSFQEDRSHSETIPGIMTTYRKHGMALGVKDKGSCRLVQRVPADQIDAGFACECRCSFRRAAEGAPLRARVHSKQWRGARTWCCRSLAPLCRERRWREEVSLVQPTAAQPKYLRLDGFAMLPAGPAGQGPGVLAFWPSTSVLKKWQIDPLRTGPGLAVARPGNRVSRMQRPRLSGHAVAAVAAARPAGLSVEVPPLVPPLPGIRPASSLVATPAGPEGSEGPLHELVLAVSAGAWCNEGPRGEDEGEVEHHDNDEDEDDEDDASLGQAKKEQLAKLGLPECSDFTTETADGHTLWTWGE